MFLKKKNIKFDYKIVETFKGFVSDLVTDNFNHLKIMNIGNVNLFVCVLRIYNLFLNLAENKTKYN